MNTIRQLIDLIEQDTAQGAGCIFFARDTQRFLIAQRSNQVSHPGTWGTWGGAMETGETPQDTTRREAMEESGYTGPFVLQPLSVYRKRGFSYWNYLAVVDHEFQPKINWEVQDYAWCAYGDWPQPLHFGLKALLNDSNLSLRADEA